MISCGEIAGLHSEIDPKAGKMSTYMYMYEQEGSPSPVSMYKTRACMLPHCLESLRLLPVHSQGLCLLCKPTSAGKGGSGSMLPQEILVF